MAVEGLSMAAMRIRRENINNKQFSHITIENNLPETYTTILIPIFCMHLLQNLILNT